MEYTTLDFFNHLDYEKGHSVGPGVNEDHIAKAIVSVIEAARSRGQSLDEVMAELLADDALLDRRIRLILGDIVAQAWEKL